MKSRDDFGFFREQIVLNLLLIHIPKDFFFQVIVVAIVFVQPDRVVNVVLLIITVDDPSL
jgi:hypothetical protein